MIEARKWKPAPSEEGFTLMEMLVAVTLIAVMAVGMWAVFRVAIRAWSRGTEFMDANQQHRSIADLVRKQMASAHGLYILADPQNPASGSLIFNGTADSLFFVSLNSLQFQESPGLTLVSYEVDQDPDGDYALIEKEARYLGRMPDESSFVNGSGPIPIFEKLSSCLFEYFDPGDAENPPQWVQEWDAQKEGSLPSAVSLSMISRDVQGNTYTRHMVVPVHSKPNDMMVNYPNLNPFDARRPR